MAQHRASGKIGKNGGSEEDVLKFFHELLMASKPPGVPGSIEQSEYLAGITECVEVVRRTLYDFVHGNLSCEIKGRGFLIGCLKELQANLRHLTWFAKCLAMGDYSQRIDFMGEFSEYFNRMSSDFYEALKSLRESESNLLKITKELHLSEERWQLAVSCTQDGVWDIDLAAHKAFFSTRMWEILRMPVIYKDIDFNPVVWGGFIHTDDLPKWAEIANSAGNKMTADRGKQYSEFRVMGGDGRYRWIGVHHMVILNNDGIPRRFVGTCEDIQEMREREDEIRRQATLDQLTNLPNRYLYNDRFLQKMVLAKRNSSSLVLMLWDLDGFKCVNDTYGHLAGDRLLVSVAEMMRSMLRESDTLARFGGDEFVMLLSSPMAHEGEIAELMASRVFNALSEPVDIGSDKVMVGASCGVSFFPKHTDDGEILFNLADEALYKAKKAGKNRAVVWAQRKPVKKAVRERKK
ncbi:MAG: sensor domain-containing diguanylate cyclase [Synergistaceae bacterium]|nr:sensor domain-containing diguanylate cyclase [Synergistaceae bacterium]